MAGQVIEYSGKKSTRFRLRFHDARGRRVSETLPKGTTRREAERALAARIADVDRGLQEAVRIGDIPRGRDALGCGVSARFAVKAEHGGQLQTHRKQASAEAV